MNLPPTVERYRRQRGVKGPWHLAGEARRNFLGAVVIPALAEETTLFATLCSLNANPATLRERFLVVVVVNHAGDASAEIRLENARTLQRLSEAGSSANLPLAWVDAASPGLELPAGGGVGMARKLGFDLALECLHWEQEPPLLVSLDADTLVRPDYLPAIRTHFRVARCGGAVLPFCHQSGATTAQDEAIVLYELYLRCYALGLARAGSPYGYHAIGSAIACRAEAYVRSGGMNRRAAGEDFYFLQQMTKTDGVTALAGTVVHPSSRVSRRTPFGTGRSILRLLAGDDQVVLFYPVACYQLLAQWLQLVAAMWQESAVSVVAAADSLHGILGDFLQREGFAVVWPRLQRQYRSREPFIAAFNGWFDGLKTRQFLYRLSRGPYPGQPPAAAVPPLLAWAGLPPADGLRAQLALLRNCHDHCVCR